MSKVTVEAKAFQAALARVVGSVERHRTIPILQCVRIAVEEGEMQIASTNLDVSISVTLAASGECEAFCTDSARLASIASTLKDRGEMTIDAGKDSAVIASGRSRFSVGLLAADQWPNLVEQQWQTSFEVSASKFARLMSALAPAISDEETRYYLNGIFLRPGAVLDDREANSLLGVATDGHKLYARSIEVEGMPATMAGIILPRWACSTIAKSFADAGMLAISCNEKKLQITVDGVQYLTKLIEGQFPDWRRVTPMKLESALSFDRSTLSGAAKIVAAAKANAKGGKAIKLSFTEDETRLEATDHDNPQFSGSDVVRHSQLSPPLSSEIGLNVDYLLEIIAELDADTIELAPPAPGGGPIVLRGAPHDDRIAVIMSMRV